MARERKQFLTDADIAGLKATAMGIFPSQPDLATELLTEVMIPLATHDAKAAAYVLAHGQDAALLIEGIKAEWDREDIIRLLLKSDKAVVRTLQLLLSKQTLAEQATYQTMVLNGQGFDKFDAEFYTSLAKRTIEGKPLTPAMFAALRKLSKSGTPAIGKYWRQIQREIVAKKLASIK